MLYDVVYHVVQDKAEVDPPILTPKYLGQEQGDPGSGDDDWP